MTAVKQVKRAVAAAIAAAGGAAEESYSAEKFKMSVQWTFSHRALLARTAARRRRSA